jgi:hypothetical protein
LCGALALRIAFLFTLPFGACPVFTLVPLLSCPLPVLRMLWLSPPVGFAPVVWLGSSTGFGAMRGLFGAIAMLGLIAAGWVQLTARRGPWPMHATPARSARSVHHTASAGRAARSMRTTASPGPTLPGAAAFVGLS